MTPSALRPAQGSGQALAEVLKKGTHVLAGAGLPEARLEAEVLLMSLLGLTRSRLYMALDRPLAGAEMAEYTRLMERRMGREPLAYIVGQREFFGLSFYVDPRVLVPRPETELLVELALQEIDSIASSGHTVEVADIGTGSGAIAISIAKHSARCHIYATDISRDALDVAQQNARAHGVSERITFLQGDLLAPLPTPVHVVVANLPYVPDELYPSLSLEVRWHEPAVALRGGRDGLEMVRRLLSGGRRCLRAGGVIIAEVGCGQWSALARFVEGALPGARSEVYRDLVGIERAVLVRL